MSKFDDMIQTMKKSEYEEKKQFLEYLVRLAERAKHQFSQEDKQALLQYAYEEVAQMLRDIPEAESYKAKDRIFECEDYLLGIVMNLCASPAQIPQENLIKIKALTELVNKERYIETTMDSIFQQPAITETDINRLLYWVRQTADEYQKGKLFEGLVHFQKDMGKLDSGAEAAMAKYIVAELRRLMALGGEDAWNTLELIADVAKYFAADNADVVAALQELLQLGRNHINSYAVDTLCGMGVEIPQPVIESLARDLEYANMTYHILQRQGKAHLFPAECATEEYLAKSDLVRWLTFPTELGKAPDAIEYIGKVKYLFKKEVFHVFKYRSDSDTLDDELKNKWLIGWSSEEGGTFSNFDEYANFAKDTTEATLKNIKKKLLG